jgi:hypothetical protein
MFGTEGIHNVVADLVLPAKLQIGQLPVSEHLPQSVLCWRLLLA